MKSKILGLFLAAMAPLPLTLSPALAQDQFPSREITLVVPFAAGGGADILGRQIAEALTSSLGVPVIVENRAGGGTLVGTEYARNAQPDGYTIVQVSNSFVINSILGEGKGVDPVDGFSPISLIANNSYVLVVNPSLGVTTIEDFIALAKEKPGELRFANSGVLTGADLVARMFMAETGVQMDQVSYTGAGPANLAVLNGEVDAFFGVISGLKGHLEAKSLVPLVSASGARDPMLPDVPTLSEKGYDINYATWYGLSAPPNTPAEIVDAISDGLREGIETGDIRRRMEEGGSLIVASSPADFRAALAQEADLMRSLEATISKP